MLGLLGLVLICFDVILFDPVLEDFEERHGLAEVKQWRFDAELILGGWVIGILRVDEATDITRCFFKILPLCRLGVPLGSTMRLSRRAKD